MAGMPRAALPSILRQPSIPTPPLQPQRLPPMARAASLSSDPSQPSVSHSQSSSQSTPSSSQPPLRSVTRKPNMPKFMRQATVAQGKYNNGHQSAILNGVEIHDRALYCLWPDQPLRRAAIELANNPYYTNFNLTLILLNCIVLMAESGRQLGGTYNFHTINNSFNSVDAIFAAFFTLEMLVKMVAGGVVFAGPSSYFRSSWNLLDFIVVLFALLNFIPSMQNVTYVRALRLLRPLKAASNIPGLRVMMNAMWAATKTLGNVFLFVFLLLFTFALFGLQIYKDSFRYRCVPLDTGFVSFDNSYGFAACSTTDNFPIPFLGPTQCDTAVSFCADVGINPYADTMGYDNILKSWVLSLITMSGEGWSDIMYCAEDTVSTLSVLFFIALTCLSNYLGGELVVAVMSVKFEDAKEEEQEKMREEEEQKRAVRDAQKKIREFKRNQKRLAKKKKSILKAKKKGAAAAAANGIEADGAVDGKGGLEEKEEEDAFGMGDSAAMAMVGDLETAQVMQLAAVIKSQRRQKRAEEEAVRREKERSSRSGGGVTQRSTNGSGTKQHLSHPFANHTRNGSVGPGEHSGRGGLKDTFFSSSQQSTPVLGRKSLRRPSAVFHASRRNSMHLPGAQDAGVEKSEKASARVADMDRRGSFVHKSLNKSMTSLTSSVYLTSTTTAGDSSNDFTHSTTIMSRLNTTFHDAASKWSMHSELFIPLPVQADNGTKLGRYWYNCRMLCHRIIFSQASFWFYSFLTTLNVAMLAVDHWGISDELQSILDGFNTAFFVFFLIELLMRLAAMQLSYFSYGYFLFDLFIVVLAGIDTATTGTYSWLSALKASRVLRMFTVFRHWPPMQKIMRQAHRSVRDLFYFSLVLFLFVFIFAQIGVQIASGRENFPLPEGPARDNWDSIGWAMIVVFQVSTPENWNQVLYDLVQGVGWGGGVFIILTLLIGHYIIESLFVVVMFSHFGTDEQEEEDRQDDEKHAAQNPGQVAPVDHVQAMLARAGVVSGLASDAHHTDEHSSLDTRPDLQRLTSFPTDSPGLSRPHTFISRPVTARQNTERRLGDVGEEGGGVGRWVEDGAKGGTPKGKAALSTATGFISLDTSGANEGTIALLPSHKPLTPLNRQLASARRAYQSERKTESGNGSAENTPQTHRRSISLSHKPPTSLPPLSIPPTISHIDSTQTSPHITFATAPTTPLRINPTGFLAGGSPMAVSSKGFLGRLARNIERSKREKAEKERAAAVEKLEKAKAASRSATASRRASRKSFISSSPHDSLNAKRASWSMKHNRESDADLTGLSRGDKAEDERKEVEPLTERGTAIEVRGQWVLREPKGEDDTSLQPPSLPQEEKEEKVEQEDERDEEKTAPAEDKATFDDKWVTTSSSEASEQQQEETKMADGPGRNRLHPSSSIAGAEGGDTVQPFVSSSFSIVRLSPAVSQVLLPPLRSPPLPNSSLLMSTHITNASVATADPDGTAAAVIVVPPPTQSSSTPPTASPPRVNSPPVAVHRTLTPSPTLPTHTLTVPHLTVDANAASSFTSAPSPTAQPAGSHLLFTPSHRALVPPSPGNRTPRSAPRSPRSPRSPLNGTALPASALVQPTYDGHVISSRRRFVIPHHCPDDRKWYRLEMPEPFTHRSMYIFGPDNALRFQLTRAIHSDAWSIGVVILILCSCVLLALDSPSLDNNSVEGQVLYWLDLVTTILYGVEMLCRFIVFGVWQSERACLRNKWNVMEFLIVVVSVASTVYPTVNGLKALRALRPLRILSRLDGAKLVVSSLGKAMLNIGNVLLVSFLLLLCMAIVGVALFKGRIQQCLQPPSGNPLPFDEADCGINGGVWTNPIWIGNYDNILNALLVLFELCTEENWPTNMYLAVDATDPGLAPVINYNQWTGIYFVVAIVIGSLFIKTLFTATILDGYSLNYAEITGAGGGTNPLQRQWIDFYKLSIDRPPPLSKPRPAQKWRYKWDLRAQRFFFDAAKSRYFEWFFLGVISLNVLALSMSFSYQPQWYSAMLAIVNSACTWLFVVEIVMLWLGTGVRDYFRTRFNQFDFVIVILTVYEFFYEQNLTSFHIGFNPSIFRVIRMIRIFKLFSKFPRLVQLGQTVWFSLPALYNVTLLMVLEYFIFSILGMALFGRVKHGFYLTNHGNYETFTSAMVTLFREMTGENWNGIMRDCMVQPPFCDDSAGECGNTVLSPLYHVGFQVMSAMLVMDLIVAIILNQFENQIEKEKRMDSAILSEHDMRVFGEHWSHFSHGKWTMPVPKLPAFLRYLPPPLGLNFLTRENNSAQLYGVEMAHFLDELRIPSDGQTVHYLDVIHQLAYRAFIRKFPDAHRMEDDEENTLAELLSEDEDEGDDDGGLMGDSGVDMAGVSDMTATVTGGGFTRTSTGKTTARSSKQQLLHKKSSSSMHLPYTTAGIRLANEDLQLVQRQAQRQFPQLTQPDRWQQMAGQVHRVVICQKMLRGVFDRKRLRAKLVKPLLLEYEDHGQRKEVEAVAARAARGQFDFQIDEATGAAVRPAESPQGTSASGEAAKDGTQETDGRTSATGGSSASQATRRLIASPSQSHNSSTSGTRGKYSVVAEIRAMKALKKGSGQNQSLSNLSVLATPSQRYQPLAIFASVDKDERMERDSIRLTGDVTPTSPVHSLTLPLLTKTVSLPLSSTTEEREDETDGDETPMFDRVRLVATALRSEGGGGGTPTNDEVKEVESKQDSRVDAGSEVSQL